jgi:hypothetical protein
VGGFGGKQQQTWCFMKKAGRIPKSLHFDGKAALLALKDYEIHFVGRERG